MKIIGLTPMLQTHDMARTIDWYRSTLGFSVVGDSTADWCRLERDGVAIMFMTNAHLGAPIATATQYFEVDDVARLWEAISDRCLAEWGPETMPYGMLEFAIRDPNGYLLSFGQPV
jgi:catechol 2,3-dioxygenase-like lactoylglutathione lyase family enzyme